MSNSITSLLSLNQEYTRLISAISSDGGELSDEQAIALDSLMMEVAQKIDVYKFVIDRLAEEANWHKDRASDHQSAAKTLLGTQEKLRHRLLFVARSMGTSEINGESVRALITPAKESVEEVDASLVPARFLREKVTYTLDKDAILKATKAGEVVPGVKITSGSTVRFYPSKPREIK